MGASVSACVCVRVCVFVCVCVCVCTYVCVFECVSAEGGYLFGRDADAAEVSGLAEMAD